MDRITAIKEGFAAAGLDLTEDKAEKLLKLYDFMVEYNKSVNLTAITEFDEVITKHFVDSVLPFSPELLPNGAKLIDVGTGAGFPALPLMICRPDLVVTLCDSLAKRCVYLEKACALIGISAEVLHARAEELAAKRRERYDIATARAVAALPVLTELCLPFVRVGGRFVALKSRKEPASDAAGAAAKLGGGEPSQVDYALPGGDPRRLVVIEKLSPTPQKYPRGYGAITKKPL